MVLLVLYIICNYFAWHIALFRFFGHSARNPFLSIVPIANLFKWFGIINLPRWWLLLLLIPFTGLVLGYMALLKTAAFYKPVLTTTDKLLLLFSGGVYLCYLSFAGNYNAENNGELKGGTVVWVVLAALVVLLSFSFTRLFITETFIIPTPAMKGTLLVGDYIVGSKSAYGFRIPNTPLASPFSHHTIKLTGTKAYLEWIKLPYYRFGKCDVQRNDLVIFNFPQGDTVVLENQGPTYYDIVRYTAAQAGLSYSEARTMIWSDPNTHIAVRPVDKREYYIKRCVGIPGDKLELKDGVLYINEAPAYRPENLNTPYLVMFKPGMEPGEALVKELGMENMSGEIDGLPANHFVVLLTQPAMEKLKAMGITNNIAPYSYGKGQIQTYAMGHDGKQVPVPSMFPNDVSRYHWNVDNFGPIRIPKKGWTVTLTDSIYQQYDRAMRVYEGNTVEQRDGKFYINGQETTSYTFKMDYYWMMGDNRHNSMDSRYWGFLPEDHVSGKVTSVAFNINPSTGLLDGNRWNITP